MRLNKEDYNKSIGILKRYNYNCINILNLRTDIMSISAINIDGMPKAPYNISDTVYNQYIKLQEDKELQKTLKEYKIVRQALELVSEDSKYIFDEFFVKGKRKWDIINEGISERTFERRKKELIYAVYEEIKKLAENWRNLIKKCVIISISKNLIYNFMDLKRQ